MPSLSHEIRQFLRIALPLSTAYLAEFAMFITTKMVVGKLAAQFLMISVIFQVFDGLQAIAARALRGIKDNFAPLWMASFGYWALGIGGGSWLAFYHNLGGAGLWWGLALGLSVTAILLCWRFNRLTSQSI